MKIFQITLKNFFLVCSLVVFFLIQMTLSTSAQEKEIDPATIIKDMTNRGTEKIAGKQILHARPSEITLTHESISFPSLTQSNVDETFGVTGFSLKLKYPYGLSFGFGGYAATLGGRGGFMGLGLHLGYDLPIFSYFKLKSGFFMGAAGGGGVPAGDGLMYRPSVALAYEFKPDLSIGAGYSYVHFPVGEIHSGQPFIQATLPSDFLHTPSQYFVDEPYPVKPETGPVLVYRKLRIGPTLKYYSIKGRNDIGGKVTSLTHDTQIRMLGFSLDHFHTQRFFSNLQTFRAYQGAGGQYMSIYVGAGYQVFVLGPLSFAPRFHIGAGGGGSIETGGGIILEPSLELALQLGSSASALFNGGWYYPPRGNKKTFATGFGISADFETLESKEHIQSATVLPNPETRSNWRATFSVERDYLDGKQSLAALDKKHSNIELFGFNLDYFVNRVLFITGGTYFPFTGGVSGYAASLFGIGLYIGPFSRFAGELSLRLGAAGGGNIPAGLGTVVQLRYGLSAAIWNGFSAHINWGKLQYVGTIEASTAEIGLSYNFGIPVRKTY